MMLNVGRSGSSFLIEILKNLIFLFFMRGFLGLVAD